MLSIPFMLHGNQIQLQKTISLFFYSRCFFFLFRISFSLQRNGKTGYSIGLYLKIKLYFKPKQRRIVKDSQFIVYNLLFRGHKIKSHANHSVLLNIVLVKQRIMNFSISYYLRVAALHQRKKEFDNQWSVRTIQVNESCNLFTAMLHCTSDRKKYLIIGWQALVASYYTGKSCNLFITVSNDIYT